MSEKVHTTKGSGEYLIRFCQASFHGSFEEQLAALQKKRKVREDLPKEEFLERLKFLHKKSLHEEEQKEYRKAAAKAAKAAKAAAKAAAEKRKQYISPRDEWVVRYLKKKADMRRA